MVAKTSRFSSHFAFILLSRHCFVLQSQAISSGKQQNIVINKSSKTFKTRLLVIYFCIPAQ